MKKNNKKVDHHIVLLILVGIAFVMILVGLLQMYQQGNNIVDYDATVQQRTIQQQNTDSLNVDNDAESFNDISSGDDIDSLSF